jgi:hypothetical protein
MKTQEITNKKSISTKEVKLLMRRLNAGEKIDMSNFWENEIPVEDGKQGIDYLLNQWKTPKGVERKNNPFGYREQETLEKFSHFEFKGDYNAGNRYHDYFTPLWVVCATDGSAFEYHMAGGKVNITG